MKKNFFVVTLDSLVDYRSKSPSLFSTLSDPWIPAAMDARAAWYLRSRSVAVASRISRSGCTAAAPSLATPVRRRRSSVAVAKANNDDDLDLLSSLAPPDIDGDVAAAYADAGGLFDVRRGDYFLDHDAIDGRNRD